MSYHVTTLYYVVFNYITSQFSHWVFFLSGCGWSGQIMSSSCHQEKKPKLASVFSNGMRAEKWEFVSLLYHLWQKYAFFEKFPVTWIIAECFHCGGSRNIQNADFDMYHPFKGNILLSLRKASNRLSFEETVSYGNIMTTTSSSRSLSLISQHSWSEKSPC